MSGKSRKSIRPWVLFLSIAVMDSLIMGAATFVDLATQQDFFLACGITIAAIILFTGLIYHALVLRKGRTSDGVRDAIACTFVLVYLVLVVYTVFFRNAPVHTTLFPQTTALLSSFTSVSAIVVGFYFTTGSFDKFIENRRSSSDPGQVNTDTKESERQEEQL